MIIQEHSLLQRSIPLWPPCQPPDPAASLHPGQPPCDPTLPATSPGSPPHPAHHPTWPTALPASSATYLALWRASTVLGLLQRLCVWGASKLPNPSNILHTPWSPSNILRTPCTKPCSSHLKFYMPPPKFYALLQNAMYYCTYSSYGWVQYFTKILPVMQ